MTMLSLLSKEDHDTVLIRDGSVNRKGKQSDASYQTKELEGEYCVAAMLRDTDSKIAPDAVALWGSRLIGAVSFSNLPSSDTCPEASSAW
jgi:hypothetical protein